MGAHSTRHPRQQPRQHRQALLHRSPLRRFSIARLNTPSASSSAPSNASSRVSMSTSSALNDSTNVRATPLSRKRKRFGAGNRKKFKPPSITKRRSRVCLRNPVSKTATHCISIPFSCVMYGRGPFHDLVWTTRPSFFFFFFFFCLLQFFAFFVAFS